MDAWRIRRKNYHRPWNELRIGRWLFFRCGTRDKSSEWDSIVVLQLLLVWPKPRAIQPTAWSNSEFCYIMLYIMFWWLSHDKSVIKPHISVNDMYPNDPKKNSTPQLLFATAFGSRIFAEQLEEFTLFQLWPWWDEAIWEWTEWTPKRQTCLTNTGWWF